MLVNVKLNFSGYKIKGLQTSLVYYISIDTAKKAKTLAILAFLCCQEFLKISTENANKMLSYQLRARSLFYTLPKSAGLGCRCDRLCDDTFLTRDLGYL